MVGTYVAQLERDRPAQEKLRALLRHLGRPSIWPTIGGLVVAGGLRRTFPRAHAERQRQSQQERQAALRWCESMAIDATTACAWLGLEASLGRVAEEFAEVFARAEAQLTTCPFFTPSEADTEPQEFAGSAEMDLLHTICRGFRPDRVLETGVAFGWSSLAILLALKDNPRARLVSVDLPYLTVDFDRWVGAAVPSELRDKWTLLRMPERYGIAKGVRSLGTIDLCHCDSVKSLEPCLQAYRRLWASLRPGGVMIANDVNTNLGWRTFCQRLARNPIIVKGDGRFVGILMKGGERPIPGQHH